MHFNDVKIAQLVFLNDPPTSMKTSNHYLIEKDQIRSLKYSILGKGFYAKYSIASKDNSGLVVRIT